MYLFEVHFDNGLEYGDNSNWTELIASKNLESANKRAKSMCESNFHSYEDPSFNVEEVKDVDGYRIILIKN